MSDLGQRMKDYETVAAARLMPKVPVLIRIDGKAFHTLTRKMARPYDQRLMHAMQQTAAYLCAQIMGCRLAYVQSDEISLLLIDYQNRDSEGWFGYEVQKMCSVAASMAAAAFVGPFREHFPENPGLPAFDARCWNLPVHEVTNYFIWRQQDATRNSVAMAAQAHFSHTRLHGVDSDQMQELLFKEKGINWNDYATDFKRGAAVRRVTYVALRNLIAKTFTHSAALATFEEPEMVTRSRWDVDHETPIFTQDREYIERLVLP